MGVAVRGVQWMDQAREGLTGPASTCWGTPRGGQRQVRGAQAWALGSAKLSGVAGVPPSLRLRLIPRLLCSPSAPRVLSWSLHSFSCFLAFVSFQRLFHYSSCFFITSVSL